MSGEIMCNEAEVNNILVGINAACTNLQNSINDLNGIDANASSLGLANFNTSQVQGSINSCKEKINSIIVSIYNVLKEWDNAEDETIRILIDLFSTLSEEDALVLMNKILSKEITIEEIETKGVQIWKEGVEYTFKSDTATITITEPNGNKYDRAYTYYMMEPKNPDPNIPTLFCLDGAGQSLLAGSTGERMEFLATTDSKDVFNDQTHSPLAAINQSGLDKPNIRLVYLTNPSNTIVACRTSSENFYKIVDEIVEQNDGKIDINNMSILGHSARRKSRSTVCEWNRNSSK